MPPRQRKPKPTPPSSRRKGWEQLSPDYRKRLGRAGVSQRDYEQGRSLTSARGHSSTPERPERALRQPMKYREYILKRDLNPADSSVDQDNVETILDDIRGASSYEAAHGVRVKLEAQNGPTKVVLAMMLGVENSIPQYASFDYQDQLTIAQIWLRAFMTHAKASEDPLLAAERIVLTGGRHGGYTGVLPDLYKRYGIPQDSKRFWQEFKRAYSQFFTHGNLPGR